MKHYTLLQDNATNIWKVSLFSVRDEILLLIPNVALLKFMVCVLDFQILIYNANRRVKFFQTTTSSINRLRWP